MFTQCPHCETVYPLPPRLLAEGRGRILCGGCEQEFDALERLREHDDYHHAPPGSTPREPIPPRLATEPAPGQGDLFALPPDPAPRPLPRPPSFIAKSAPSTGPSLRGWWLGVIVLSCTLGLQILLAQRHELAQDARWRPLLEPLCRHLGCDLPPWQDPRHLQMLARDIGPHPSMPDALLVTATLRNPGPWPQAWPQLELSLSDLDGRPLALRRFSADEYLGGEPASPALAPGESTIARLELKDPGKSAVAFAFEFR
ncbi:MAG: zinc-ribbon and DUF3426 domain-containing protein [Lysobacteraceae bacterium]|jgi:hypothetical protein